MDGTLLVARAQDQFSGGYAIYFWARSASIIATTSHPWRVPKGFMDGTLFARTVRYSRSCRTLIGTREGSKLYSRT
jgi:hypothetical protein